MSTNTILLPDAPNFSQYLRDAFVGNIEVSEIKEVRRGFDSEIGRFQHRVDEERFYELQQQFPEIERFREFLGPFYRCIRTRITFRTPETPKLATHRNMLVEEGLDAESIEEIMEDIKTRDRGELRVYPEERDREGRAPIIYNGFGPGTEDQTGANIRLVYGTFLTLRKLEDYFGDSMDKKKRGGFWNNKKWMRYDNWKNIPFP